MDHTEVEVEVGEKYVKNPAATTENGATTMKTAVTRTKFARILPTVDTRHVKMTAREREGSAGVVVTAAGIWFAINLTSLIKGHVEGLDAVGSIKHAMTIINAAEVLDAPGEANAPTLSAMAFDAASKPVIWLRLLMTN